MGLRALLEAFIAAVVSVGVLMFGAILIGSTITDPIGSIVAMFGWAILSVGILVSFMMWGEE